MSMMGAAGRPWALCVVMGALWLGGCTSQTGASEGEAPEEPQAIEQAAAHPGRWLLPADVSAAGNAQYLAYESAGAWNNGQSCTGTFTDGARVLAEQLVAFTGASSYGGYNCRRNTGSPSQLSVHGTGRAIDLFVPLSGGEADNDVGDPIANWLVENAERIGIQFIVWDRTSWGPHRSQPKDRYYSGPHPHHDHLHIELTSAGARMETPYFREGGTVGCQPGCEGDLITNRDCSTGDCSVFGSSCVDDNLGPRCVFFACPAQGGGTACLDEDTIVNCDNGAASFGDCSAFGSRCVDDELGARCVFFACPAQGTSSGCLDDGTIVHCDNGEAQIGECSAFAAWCSTVGSSATDWAPGDARCVSVFCAESPTTQPVAHQSCFLDGELLSCDENGAMEDKQACPPGHYCTVHPEPRCEPGALCPPWDGVLPSSAEEAQARTTLVCVDERTLGQCLSGAVVSATDCNEVEGYCSTAGSPVPRCVSEHCVAGPGEAPVARDFCFSAASVASCDGDGQLIVTECAEGERCVEDGGARCDVGQGGPDAGAPDVGEPDAGEPDAGEADTGSEDTGAPQADVGGGGSGGTSGATSETGGGDGAEASETTIKDSGCAQAPGRRGAPLGALLMLAAVWGLMRRR